MKYTIRLPANDNLERKVAQLLKRPVGRPSYKPVVRYRSFFYQAASWKSARRIVAKVELHFGELFPRVGFIVTNFQTSSRAVVRFYNKRGTAEQWIKEGKQAVAMTRLSCHRFHANEVRLWLSVIAYYWATCGGGWRCRLGSPTGRCENRGPSDQTRPLLLVAPGGESSDAAAVWRHAAADRSAAVASGIGGV